MQRKFHLHSLDDSQILPLLYTTTRILLVYLVVINPSNLPKQEVNIAIERMLNKVIVEVIRVRNLAVVAVHIIEDDSSENTDMEC